MDIRLSTASTAPYRDPHHQTSPLPAEELSEEEKVMAGHLQSQSVRSAARRASTSGGSPKRNASLSMNLRLKIPEYAASVTTRKQMGKESSRHDRTQDALPEPVVITFYGLTATMGKPNVFSREWDKNRYHFCAIITLYSTSPSSFTVLNLWLSRDSAFTLESCRTRPLPPLRCLPQLTP